MAKERMTTKDAYELVNKYNEDRENHRNKLQELNLTSWQIFDLLKDRDKKHLSPEIKEAILKVKKANKRAYETAKWNLGIDDISRENLTEREKEDLAYGYKTAKKRSYNIEKGKDYRLSSDLKAVERDIEQKRKDITSILKEIIWNIKKSDENSVIYADLDEIESIIKDLHGKITIISNEWTIYLWPIILPFKITEIYKTLNWHGTDIDINFDTISYNYYFPVHNSEDMYKHINELDKIEKKLKKYRKKQIKKQK